MKFGLYLLLLSLFALKLCYSEDDTNPEDELEDTANDEQEGVKEEDDVLVLTNDNFDEVVNSKDTVLVEFYAPWCGHCKQLAPEYAQAAKVLKDADPPVTLAKVDCTQEEALSTRFGVTGYPTLKFLKKGNPFDYDGPRQKDGIVSYMKEKADPSWKPPPEAVITLNKDNFEETLETEELILVEFYAPWCGHCKQLAPVYEKAAQDLKNQVPPIPLGKVDATQNAELATKYGVTGYPTLKIFRNGRAKDYGGSRDQQGIVNYMISQAGEAAHELSNQAAIKRFMQVNYIAVVGFFKSSDDPNLRLYMDAANDMRDDFSFAYNLDTKTREAYKVNSGSVVVLNPERFYTKHEPKWHVLKKDDVSIENIVKFVKKHKVPLVGEYGTSTEKLYADIKPLCLVFYTVDWTHDHKEATQLWRHKIAAIAKDYKDIGFAIADESNHDQLIKQFNLDDSPEDLNVGLLGKDNKRYRMEPMEDFDEDEVREFLDNFKNGKLSPEVRSQPVPKKQSGPVQIVVGKNFEEVVMDKTKDVLIEFYAPWCGHCKQLDPLYKKMAKNLKSMKNLVIAKMDSTANDSPDAFKVAGFPTIYFATAKDKNNPIKFEGSRREIEDFEKFMREHATVSFGKSLKEEL